MMSKKQIKEDILKKVFAHVNSVSDQRFSDFWGELAQAYPEFQVTLIAYKAICDELDESKLTDSYKSWAKTKQGIRSYIESGVFYDRDEDPGFVLVEAEITAFDLHSFILFLKKENYDIPHHIFKMGSNEDELIALSVHKIINKKGTSWYNLFYKSEF
jgi:hypothetical protein